MASTRRRIGRRATLLGAGAVILAAPALGAAPPVTMGLTPVFLDSDIRLLAQIEAYLARRLGRPVQLVQRRTYQEITALLIAGALDTAWICGLPFVRNRARLRLTGVPVYRGSPTYRAYLIARANAPAVSMGELAGQVHAFSDPDSNSGYLVTRALLAQDGRTPETFFSKTFFTYGHRNVIRAVASGLAHSGSVDGYVWDVLSEIDPALTAPTRVVRVSEPLGFPPFASPTQPRDPGVARALREALAGMAGAEDGKAILGTLRLDGFVDGRAEMFDGIAELLRQAERVG
ncbi:MAG: PhnD/SsuA/transferrin family substrate-binding protein [Tagaea sp.]|nr:PhnD/SsuA/transferrin family substrate-binding protein [Tagaea sp.]